MDSMSNVSDNRDLNSALDETNGAFEESIQVKRYLSLGSIPANGQAPLKNYTIYNTTAVVDDIGIEKANSNDNVYALGDLQFQVRMKIQEPTASNPGDRIVYEGVEYRLVQKPMTEYLNGKLYYTCIARRITD